MSAVVQMSNPAALRAVRDAVCTRASSIGAKEDERQKALYIGYQHVRDGKSVGWAISQALRSLRGKEPAVHGGYPEPPRAA